MRYIFICFLFLFLQGDLSAKRFYGKGGHFPLKEFRKDTTHAAASVPVPAKAAVNPYAQEIADLNSSISNMRIIGIAAILLFGFLIFQILNSLVKRTNIALRSLDGKIDETKRDLDRYIYELEKEAIRIDNRLVQVLHEQLSIVKDRKEVIGDLKGLDFSPVVDHRLAIKVGEEIHRMKKRIENMDKEVKGLGALVNSINRLNEELAGNGYEMEELIGKKYISGMKMEARFVDNPEIPPGEEIITDVLRPEIKYKGEVIQVAKVEVGKSY